MVMPQNNTPSHTHITAYVTSRVPPPGIFVPYGFQYTILAHVARALAFWIIRSKRCHNFTLYALNFHAIDTHILDQWISHVAKFNPKDEEIIPTWMPSLVHQPT